MMKEKKKTREEIIKELQQLRQRVTELEALETEHKLVDAQEERHKNLQILFNSLEDCLFVLDMEGCILSVNHVVLRRLGYSEAELLGEKVFKVHHPDRQDEAAAIIADIVAGKIDSCPIPLMTKDGTQIPVETKVTRGRWGNQDVFFGVSRDISERKQAEEALRESEQKYRMLFEGAKDAIYITTREGILLDANQSLLDLFGYTREDLEGFDINKTYFDPASRLRFQKEIEKAGSLRDYEMKLRKKDGTEIDCLISATVRKDSEGDILGYQGIIHDITDIKRTEEELAYMATHDTLTGLPNRLLFNDRLTLALAQALRNKKKLAVMLLDLDHFKDVNDTLGHNGGDQLLCEVSNLLIGLLRKSDTIARMGGDEFLLLLHEIAQERYALNVARKLINAFRKPFVIDDHEFHITTSVGIAIYPEDGEDINTLLGNADIAMYHAKQKGRNAYQRYSSTMKNKDRRITGIT